MRAHISYLIHVSFFIIGAVALELALQHAHDHQQMMTIDNHIVLLQHHRTQHVPVLTRHRTKLFHTFDALCLCLTQ